MHSARFFPSFKRSLLNQFHEKEFSLKCSIWYPSIACNFTSSTTIGTKKLPRLCDCTYNHTLQKVLNRKFCSKVSENIRTFVVPEIQKSKSPESAKFMKKHKNRRESIITKSNDPDTFGDIVNCQVYDALEDKLGNESDFHEDCEIFIPLDRKYRTPKDYFKGMRDFVKKKKLKQALELFLDMKNHLVPPDHVHYTFMIGACGRAGYTEMAFKLLRQMTHKGFKPTPATLTGLFNSCAECPNAAYGLKKATLLKQKISLKFWDVAVPTYHAMIKAFGRCGDIKTAFEIVDEMMESDCIVTVETYSTLLISCITDKEAGFTHAIAVWRKMISKKICPNHFSYNLLLRAARDCGVGPEEVSCNILQHWSSYLPRSVDGEKSAVSREDTLALPGFPHPDTKLIGEPLSCDRNISSQGKTAALKNKKEIDIESLLTGNNSIETVAPASTDCSNSKLPTVVNMLLPRPVNGPMIIDLGQINNAADRLLLIGGVKGVLELMEKDNVAPDIKTFTMLLKIIPDSTEEEHELLSLMENYKLKLDVDFFNILIKKRNFRKDFNAAKEALMLLTKKGLSPDIVTYGVLALGCTRKKDGLQLLRDMKNLRLCPNIEIFGALLNSASRLIDFEYICALLKAMKNEAVKPSPKFLQLLEKIRNIARDKILAMEQGREIRKLSFSKQSYNEFCQYYEQWLKMTNVEEEIDPWLQYKTDIIARVPEEHYHV